jgi:starch synthase
MTKVLYICSEAFPLIKTGGLADVAGGLTRALQNNGQDVRLLLPAYREILDKLDRPKLVAQTFHYGLRIRILETCLPGTRVKTWLLDCPSAFDRAGNPYLDNMGQPWPDNAFRFTLLAQTAVDVALNRCGLSWQPDVVHCNDWQSALVPALLATFPQRPATVFTIHNLAYQGAFSSNTFFDLGLPVQLWGMHGVEFYQQFCFIKGGLVYADRINTVSPTYAAEILQTGLGFGFDGLLRQRKEKLSGIINGIDTDIWNPATDKHLVQNYSHQSVDAKTINKTALQCQLSLTVSNRIPVVGMISRLVEQKGLQSLLGAMQELMSLPLQLVIIGSGEKHYERTLLDWSRSYPDKLSVTIGYDEQLSHRVEAAADIYLMPSTFEPCGLNQLYSLAYGTLPLVRNVGGLADTVIDCNAANIADKTANGFIIEADTPSALLETMQRALQNFKHKSLWQQLQLNAMRQDHSWQSSARQYSDLYQLAIDDNSR